MRRSRWFASGVVSTRVHQWAKNLLVFVPLIVSHHFGDRLGDRGAWVRDFWAFMAMNFVASAGYIMNDLFDLDADRFSPTKRLRPLAAGQISARGAIIWMVALLAAGLSLGSTISATLVTVLGAYFGASVLYSIVLKRVFILDVIVLSLLYTARLIVGQEATGIICSVWLLSFSIFLFVSLAFVKRYSELYDHHKTFRHKVAGREYRVSDLQPVQSLGIASGYLSVLIVALYIRSPEVLKLYPAPEYLWLSVPTLVYWISRTWVLATRGAIHQDPIVFALKDRASYACLLLMGVAGAIASMRHG